MIDIEKKIEEIRQKPEHIRLRYVYGMVGGCMIIVLFIWFISLRVNFANFGSKLNGNVKSVKNQFNVNIQEENSDSSNNSSLDQKNENGEVEINELLEEAKKTKELEKQKVEEGIVN